MKVAVDAMGGDNSPQLVVQGALRAVSEPGVEVILVGSQDSVGREVGAGSLPPGVDFQSCEDVVGMNESPLKAVCRRKSSSIRVAFELVRQGKADALVSAGNSGATLAAGVLTLGRMIGVERPGIAGVFPGRHGPVVVMDVGANVDCRPGHLLQFGALAHSFCRSFLGIASPRIGLLNIGEESGKGNELVRRAGELFRGGPLNFLGNVEGGDILSGKVDAVVCDGFVGNVVLKLAEGVSEAIGRSILKDLRRSLSGRPAMELAGNVLRLLEGKYNYQAYGGAPLLGINGVALVCHGGSSARAIENAVKSASRYAEGGVTEQMAGILASLKFDRAPDPDN